MQLMCSDGELRQFRCLRDILIERGFEEDLLSRDRNMLSCTINPSIGLSEAMKMTRNGVHVPFYFTYRSKKARRHSAAGFYTSELVRIGGYISFASSIGDDYGNYIDSSMDTLTLIGRILSRFRRQEKIQPEFRSLITGPRADELIFDHGYKLSEIYIPDDRPDEYLVFSSSEGESHDLLFVAHASVLGYCSKIYLSVQ